MTEAPGMAEALDEELGRPSGRGTGAAWVILLALVVTAGGFALARHATHHPATAAPPRRDFRAAEIVRLPTAPPAVPAHFVDPPRCPRATDRQVACITSLTVPGSFRTAVRTVLPRMQQQEAVTDVLRPTGPEHVVGLWSRRFTGRFLAGRIRIAVSLHSVGVPVVQVSFNRGRTIVYTRARLGPYTVQVEVSAPTGRVPAVAELQSLAADERLVHIVATGAGQ